MRKKAIKGIHVGIRFHGSLLEKVRKAAQDDRRSVGDFIRVTLEKVLDGQFKKSA